MNPKEVSDKVEAVLNAHLSEMEDHAEGDILVDWVMVAYVTNPDSERQSAYPLLWSNGEIPVYRAIGLLRVGLMSLNDAVE
jgi:hypothetical protein